MDFLDNVHFVLSATLSSLHSLKLCFPFSSEAQMSVDVSTTDHVDKLDLNDKKKNFIERMCDDKVSANRGPIRR